MSKANRITLSAGGALVILLVVGLAVFALRDRGGGSTLAGLQTGPAPWPSDDIGLTDRMHEIGVPFSDMEGTALHIHPQLWVFVGGTHVPVPASIGIEPSGETMAALHTHDDSGIIHDESPVVRSYSLGEFFDVWGVRLTRTCVGGYCATGDKRLAALVDARPFTGDPRDIPLRNGENIVLAYGTNAEIAKATR